MGCKLVRDGNEAWCRAHGVSGEWRISPDLRSALLRKVFEEAGEYAEHRDGPSYSTCSMSSLRSSPG